MLGTFRATRRAAVVAAMVAISLGALGAPAFGAASGGGGLVDGAVTVFDVSVSQVSDDNHNGRVDVGDTFGVTFSFANGLPEAITSVELVYDELTTRRVLPVEFPYGSTPTATLWALPVTAAMLAPDGSGLILDGLALMYITKSDSTPVSVPMPAPALVQTASPLTVTPSVRVTHLGSPATAAPVAGDTISVSATVKNSNLLPITLTSVSGLAPLAGPVTVPGKGSVTLAAATTRVTNAMLYAGPFDPADVVVNWASGDVTGSATATTAPVALATPVESFDVDLTVTVSHPDGTPVPASSAAAGDMVNYEWTGTNTGTVGYGYFVFLRTDPYTGTITGGYGKGFTDGRQWAPGMSLSTALAGEEDLFRSSPGGYWKPVTLTSADIARGYLDLGAQFKARFSDFGPNPFTGTPVGERIYFRDVAADLLWGIEVTYTDDNHDGLPSEGDTATIKGILTNASEYPLDRVSVVTDAGDVGYGTFPAFPTSIPAYETATRSFTHTITAADVAAGSIIYHASVALGGKVETSAGGSLGGITFARRLSDLDGLTPGGVALCLPGSLDFAIAGGTAKLMPGSCSTGADETGYSTALFTDDEAIVGNGFDLQLPPTLETGTYRAALYKDGRVVGWTEVPVRTELDAMADALQVTWTSAEIVADAGVIGKVDVGETVLYHGTMTLDAGAPGGGTVLGMQFGAGPMRLPSSVTGSFGVMTPGVASDLAVPVVASPILVDPLGGGLYTSVVALSGSTSTGQFSLPAPDLPIVATAERPVTVTATLEQADPTSPLAVGSVVRPRLTFTATSPASVNVSYHPAGGTGAMQWGFASSGSPLVILGAERTLTLADFRAGSIVEPAASADWKVSSPVPVAPVAQGSFAVPEASLTLPALDASSTTAVTTTVHSPDRSIVRASGDARVGDLLDYALDVRATGNLSLDYVQLKRTAPGASSVTVADAGVTPGSTASSLVSSGKASSETGKGLAPYVLTRDDIVRGYVDLTFEVTAAPDGTFEGLTAADFTQTVTRRVELGTVAPPAPTVTVSPAVADVNADGKASIGESVLFTVTVSNTGLEPFTSLTVADASGATATGLPAFPATLAAGESVTRSFTHVITQADFARGSVGAAVEVAADFYPAATTTSIVTPLTFQAHAADLTDATKGGVVVCDASGRAVSDVTLGQKVSVKPGSCASTADPAGYRVVAFSAPLELAHDTFAATIPLSLGLGAHRLALYNGAGELVGWQTVTVGAVAGDEPATSGGGLAGTGVNGDVAGLAGLGAALFAMGVAVLAVRRSRVG